MSRVKKLKVGKAFRVGWRDHLLVSETWLDAEKFDKEVSADCYSYGVVVRDDGEYLTLAGSLCLTKNRDGSTEDVNHGDVNRILKSAIFEVKEIK